jgi:hypothetical protein
MHSKLARALIERGVIQPNTVLQVYQSAKGLSCVCDSYALTDYKVLGAKAIGEYVFFEVETTDSAPQRQRVRSDYVVSVDGMAINRVAAAHQLQENGSPIQRASRRRRKPVRLALTYDG